MRIYLLLQLSMHLVVYIMERYELTFTMIVRRIMLKRTTLEVNIMRYGIHCAKLLPITTTDSWRKFIIMFRQDMKNLTDIKAGHCIIGISLSEFKQFCHGVWSQKHNFVTIDLTSTPMDGKYLQNFN